MELKNKILLSIPDDCSMQPHKLEGGASETNLNAIRQLLMERLITVVGDSCGGFIYFELTYRGKLRKAELIKLQNRSVLEKGSDAVGRGWRFVRPSVGRIVEGAIIAVVSAIISGAICFWLGRATTPNIPDKGPDNYKQEHSDNLTIRLD